MNLEVRELKKHLGGQRISGWKNAARQCNYLKMCVTASGKRGWGNGAYMSIFGNV